MFGGDINDIPVFDMKDVDRLKLQIFKLKCKIRDLETDKAKLKQALRLKGVKKYSNWAIYI